MIYLRECGYGSDDNVEGKKGEEEIKKDKKIIMLKKGK